MKTIFTGEKDPRLAKSVIGETLTDMLETDPDVIYLDADLMSCIGTLKYAKTHPDRAIECGVAEANMIGVACGLASAGFKPVCHTFGPFASRRCFDQVFLSGAYAKNDITVIGTDPGVTAALNGGTHMPFEDTALYRTIPTATIFDPTDMVQLENVLRQSVDMPGVKYIRIGRKDLPKIYEADTLFEVGKALVVREGKDATVIAAGIMLGEALTAAENLSRLGIEIEVIDPFTVKPLDALTICRSARKTGAVVVAENHSIHGGLYNAVLEVLAAGCPVPAAAVAVEDEFGEVGPQSYLQKRFGLTADHIEEEVKEIIQRKHV